MILTQNVTSWDGFVLSGRGTVKILTIYTVAFGRCWLIFIICRIVHTVIHYSFHFKTSHLVGRKLLMKMAMLSL